MGTFARRGWGSLLEFRILGPFEVLEDGRQLPLGGPRQRALLAILLLHRAETVSNDRLVDELWGEDSPPTAAKTLQGYVSRLRRVLGDEALVTRGGGYALDVDAGQVDAHQFESLAVAGRQALGSGDPARGRELLGAALDLWRGEALGDLAYERFAAGESAHLEEGRLVALEDRIEADLALGRHRQLVGELEKLTARHPRRERLAAALMLSLHRCGRHADALDVYRRVRADLQDELGLEPGAELRTLEQKILIHDPALDFTTPEVAPSPPSPEPRLTPPPGGPTAPGATRTRGRALLIAGGALLLSAAIAVVVVLLSGGGSPPSAQPNSVAAIDTGSDEVVAHVGVGAGPRAIAFGSGSLWVANADDQTVTRVDPATLQVLRTLPLAGPPTGLASSAGAIWATTSNASAPSVSASRIDPQFDSIDHTVQIGNVVPGSAVSVAADGAELWVVPYSGDVTALDPETGRVKRQIDPNSAPSDAAAGDGALWASDSEANIVVRIDPTGLVTPIPVGHGPSGVVVGEGAVWVADTADDSVVRIDPETRAVTATIPVGSAPVGVAVGAGSVWVANSGDGTVTRIDPSRNSAIATIAVGGSPQAIALAGDRAWVTVDAPALPPAGVASAGGTLRVVSTYDVSWLDPALANDPLSWQLLYATCAKLLNYPDSGAPRASQLVPEVAQSLPTRSADGRTYTFTIRPGFRFSPPSNEAVTAQTFKYTIERSLNPAMKSMLAGEFRDIAGASAYMAGTAAHISGVIARGDTLAIRLVAPAPDLLARLAEPMACAVPSDTPIDPSGLRVIPSAGPYRVASYTPGQGIVLTRNPNYSGRRPHALDRIQVSVNAAGAHAISEVETGKADYAVDGAVTTADAASLALRYGRGSAAARGGRQQYFVVAYPELDFLAMNSQRPLFRDLRLRQAVNFAIDRAALARAGNPGLPLPDTPTDHYLPPGLPGYRDIHVYPSAPDLSEARRLARGHEGSTAVLYTCDTPTCAEQTQLITNDLAAIGLRVAVRRFPAATLYTKLATPGEPFDIGSVGWGTSYPDPDAILNFFLESGQVIPPLADPAVAARLAAAARLSGPTRYLTYGRLDAELARTAAPMVAYGNASQHELFSARIGCQAYGVFGADLAALCVRKSG